MLRKFARKISFEIRRPDHEGRSAGIVQVQADPELVVSHPVEAPTQEAKGPPTKVVDGVRVSSMFPSAKLLSAFAYEPDDDDIFVVSFPKSGQSWILYIIHLLRSNCGSLDNIFEETVFLEMFGSDLVKNRPRPRLIKTHLPFEKLPWNDNAKYILLCRNPFDCCVSFYYFSLGYKTLFNWSGSSFGNFLDTFLAGQTFYGDYFEHLRSLYRERQRPNVLFLTYEELKVSQYEVVRKLAQFLGGDCAKYINDEDFINKVVQMSSFDTMKEDFQKFQPNFLAEDDGYRIIRQGSIGDEERMFSEEQAKKMAERFRSELGKSGARHLWAKYGIPSVYGSNLNALSNNSNGKCRSKSWAGLEADRSLCISEVERY